jgi:hypothetical protein
MASSSGLRSCNRLVYLQQKSGSQLYRDCSASYVQESEVLTVCTYTHIIPIHAKIGKHAYMDINTYTHIYVGIREHGCCRHTEHIHIHIYTCTQTSHQWRRHNKQLNLPCKGNQHIHILMHIHIYVPMPIERARKRDDKQLNLRCRGAQRRIQRVDMLARKQKAVWPVACS